MATGPLLHIGKAALWQVAELFSTSNDSYQVSMTTGTIVLSDLWDIKTRALERQINIYIKKNICFQRESKPRLSALRWIHAALHQNGSFHILKIYTKNRWDVFQLLKKYLKNCLKSLKTALFFIPIQYS